MFGVLDPGNDAARRDEVIDVEEDLLDLSLGLGGDRGLVDGLDDAIELVLPRDLSVGHRGAGQLGRVQVSRRGGDQGGEERYQGGKAHRGRTSDITLRFFNA